MLGKLEHNPVQVENFKRTLEMSFKMEKPEMPRGNKHCALSFYIALPPTKLKKTQSRDNIKAKFVSKQWFE